MKIIIPLATMFIICIIYLIKDKNKNHRAIFWRDER